MPERMYSWATPRSVVQAPIDDVKPGGPGQRGRMQNIGRAAELRDSVKDANIRPHPRRDFHPLPRWLPFDERFLLPSVRDGRSSNVL